MLPTLALDLPPAATYDEWRDFGRRLCSGARQVQWLIGDWLIAGVERYGDKAQDEAQAIFRSAEVRLDPIIKTCRRFPVDQRHSALTYAHHSAVMDIEDDRAAHAILDQAETAALTITAVKAQVRIASNRQERLDSWSDDTVEDQEFRAMAQAWNRASTRVAREMFVDSVTEANYGEIEL